MSCNHAKWDEKWVMMTTAIGRCPSRQSVTAIVQRQLGRGDSDEWTFGAQMEIVGRATLAAEPFTPHSTTNA
ncbi:hypothetical protein ACNKHX_25470 [Shigella flexneri]